MIARNVRFIALPIRCDSSSLANRLKLLFFITASRQNKQKEKKTGFRQRSSFCHHRLSVAKEVGVRESRGGNGRCLLARAWSENAILKKQKIRAQSEIEKLSLSFHHLVETKWKRSTHVWGLSSSNISFVATMFFCKSSSNPKEEEVFVSLFSLSPLLGKKKYSLQETWDWLIRIRVSSHRSVVHWPVHFSVIIVSVAPFHQKRERERERERERVEKKESRLISVVSSGIVQTLTNRKFFS